MMTKVLYSVFVALFALAFMANSAPNLTVQELLAKSVAGDHRPDRWKARDEFRHPVETLAFFGLESDMTVLELWPGTGWYADILAPTLKPHGQYIAASFGAQAKPAFRAEMDQTFRKQLAAKPALFDQVQIVTLDPPNIIELGADNSVDMVLTFRNSHNWTKAGVEQDVYAAVFKVLKPGGIFGVVQHRAKVGADPEGGKKGYLPEAFVINIASQAGFELHSQSEINANPKDTADYPAGVWTLPPMLRGGKDNGYKYKAVGESDRMTLKFIKPME